ncbi:unnamed protein product [Ceratitis capitata]|uniref:(Mediterranean fruit fly) hypothetical protein n=1 Tax=Ceratitis capitata TaxID=7213 RepID=A0A811UIU7_CERCA|nr:unnamed protein product [Ceratitis capitata]
MKFQNRSVRMRRRRCPTKATVQHLGKGCCEDNITAANLKHAIPVAAENSTNLVKMDKDRKVARLLLNNLLNRVCGESENE